jgi:hypothetical protein
MTISKKASIHAGCDEISAPRFGSTAPGDAAKLSPHIGLGHSNTAHVTAMTDEYPSDASQPAVPVVPTGHEKHCFIVMPFGRDGSEQKWFRGWYEVVIKQAVIEAGFEPKLAAAEEQPGAINDEIRAHLALDPMVVVDLGGAEPEDEPNPNVMYELGIRHALGLPLVMMAWKGQRLPFDVSNQRIIMEERDLVDLETNRKRLITFIHAAQQGKYYRPMEAVGRMATIAAASETLGEDSLLRALAQEVRDLRSSVLQVSSHREPRRLRDHVPTVKKLIQGKVFRKDLYPHFQEQGGDPGAWAMLLRTQLSAEDATAMNDWNGDDWKKFVSKRWKEIQDSALIGAAPAYGLDDALLDAAKELLPAQPWPSGIHRELADKLGLTPAQASKYIHALIKRGDFLEQVDGQLLPDNGAALRNSFQVVDLE